MGNAIFANICSAAETDDCCDDDDLNDSQRKSDDETPPDEPKLKTFKTAIHSLEEIQYFLQYHGHNSDSLSSVIDTLVDIQTKNDPIQAPNIKNAQQQAIPPKTEDATKWATKTWDTWAAQRTISDEEWTVADIMHLSSVKIDEMTEKHLNYWIPRFILKFNNKN